MDYEYEPYPRQVNSIIVQELSGGNWVDLITIPIGNGEELSPEDIQEVIEAIHKMLYKGDKVELSTQGVKLCLRGLNESGRTFRVAASYFKVNGPILPYA